MHCQLGSILICAVSFRFLQLNLLVATPVAEEGLDFRACNAVIRFDGLTTIWGYIQSRGRARAVDSRFIVLAEARSAEAAKYLEYVGQEAMLHDLYKERPAEDDDVGEPDLDDLPTYVTPGEAVLTHAGAIPTLANFCQLLRFDAFTPLQKPHYAVVSLGEASWQASLTLPKIAALEKLAWVSDPLGKGGRAVEQNAIPKEVEVVFPNVFGNVYASSTAFLHVFKLSSADSETRIGLVCASSSPSTFSSVLYSPSGSDVRAQVVQTSEIRWDGVGERDRHLQQLENFARTCVRVAINRRINDDERFFALWTPVITDGEIDWELLDKAFEPFDVERIKEGDLVVVPFRCPSQRIGTFDRVREDVDNSSRTLDVVMEPPRKKLKMMERLSEYWLYTKICYDFRELSADSKDLIVEFDPLNLRLYNALEPRQPIARVAEPKPSLCRTFPAAMIRTSSLPLAFWQAFVFETVGDSALKLATSVHIYLTYPTAEEDRLTRLRENSVSNRFLRTRSLESGYASCIIPHLFRTSTFVPPSSDEAVLSENGTEMTKKVHRRVLSDTMEATLGAAVATNPGDFSLVLETGMQLGLYFGGTTPWADREEGKKLLDVEPRRAGKSMRSVEKALGYEVKTQGALMGQALVHRSYAAQVPSYERSEYLGDAILDFWATSRLFSRFPSSTPCTLSYKRALLVSNGVLALLAVEKLDLHKAVLHSSPALEQAMMDASQEKVLGDVLEALLAAIFIDSSFQLEPVFKVLDGLYEEVMPLLGEGEIRDPYSWFLMWRDARLCKELSIKVIRVDPPPPTAPHTPTPTLPSSFTATAFFHSSPSPSSFGESLFPPIQSSSKVVARQMAAKEALRVLKGMKERGEVEGVYGCRREWERGRREEGEGEEGEGGGGG
ncbi:hypothetical protein JCM8547_009121 [Rhodosporidiobolus lusitaniae]